VARPERTCVGCRRRRPQDELVRLVCRDDAVVTAGRGDPGRGAYVCPSLACLEAAERRRAFARAFRRPVRLAPSVRDEVAGRETAGRR